MRIIVRNIALSLAVTFKIDNKNNGSCLLILRQIESMEVSKKIDTISCHWKNVVIKIIVIERRKKKDVDERLLYNE